MPCLSVKDPQFGLVTSSVARFGKITPSWGNFTENLGNLWDRRSKRGWDVGPLFRRCQDGGRSGENRNRMQHLGKDENQVTFLINPQYFFSSEHGNKKITHF